MTKEDYIKCQMKSADNDFINELLYDHYNNEVKNMSDEDLIKSAANYGWSPDNKVRSSKIIGIELAYDDPDYYDGVSYWMCPHCGIAWNRFTGEKTDKFKEEMLPKFKKN